MTSNTWRLLHSARATDDRSTSFIRSQEKLSNSVLLHALRIVQPSRGKCALSIASIEVSGTVLGASCSPSQATVPLARTSATRDGVAPKVARRIRWRTGSVASVLWLRGVVGGLGTAAAAGDPSSPGAPAAVTAAPTAAAVRTPRRDTWAVTSVPSTANGHLLLGREGERLREWVCERAAGGHREHLLRRRRRCGHLPPTRRDLLCRGRRRPDPPAALSRAGPRSGGGTLPDVPRAVLGRPPDVLRRARAPATAHAARPVRHRTRRAGRVAGADAGCGRRDRPACRAGGRPVGLPGDGRTQHGQLLRMTPRP